MERLHFGIFMRLQLDPDSVYIQTIMNIFSSIYNTSLGADYNTIPGSVGGYETIYTITWLFTVLLSVQLLLLLLLSMMLFLLLLLLLFLLLGVVIDAAS